MLPSVRAQIDGTMPDDRGPSYVTMAEATADDPRIARFLALPPRDRAAMIAALEAFLAEREQQAAAIREHIAALRDAAAAPAVPAISAAA